MRAVFAVLNTVCMTSVEARWRGRAGDFTRHLKNSIQNWMYMIFTTRILPHVEEILEVYVRLNFLENQHDVQPVRKASYMEDSSL